jgi:uncharacterized membrane protein
MIKLIGILVVALGFAFRFNTLLVVMVAGIVTGLVSGMSFNEVMALFGKFFVENRYMSLAIVLSLPVIGVLERYGLKERAEALIRKAKNATTGRVLLTYLFIREVSAAIGLNIGGHAQAVRPLIAPMAEGAAVARYGNISEKMRSEIRAYAATAENTGWFFGEDIFIATGAILLMKGFFDSLGMNVDIWDMALWGIPTALAAFFVSWIRFNRLDKRIANDAQNSHVESAQQDEKGAQA